MFFSGCDQRLDRERPEHGITVQASKAALGPLRPQLLTAGLNERAAKEFLATTKVERAEPGLVTMAHLYAARAYDVAGKRDDALAQYKEVLSRPNVYDAHEEAKRGMKQAYKAEVAARPADVSTN